MKKLVFFSTITLIIVGCSKQNTEPIEEVNTSSDLAIRVANTPEYNRHAAPTRAAKQITVTNPETGETTIYFDCRDAGSTCDVGENPSPQPTPTSRINNLTEINSIRQQFASNFVNQKSKVSEDQYLQSNISVAKKIFPILEYNDKA